MFDFSEKDFKVDIVNMFIKPNETMINEIKEVVMTILNQNISKEIEIMKKYNWNYGIEKYSNYNKTSLDGLNSRFKWALKRMPKFKGRS